ncbi:uncharacterized protein LOC123895407 isoform X3 [Trifolium pratense]|uniref:uncharacterized protein LOC123895407 isoform X3 n=2 Tax=Trifolium pratense TaxID=57577 RepID=UPI001E69387C|nr:uncharacterized protein LOC123895407 isoform X3 [Trifolium pratense]XP_045801662.1 uncharacterized protein LOC123895407 isoform X3 [Trifolium pratense]
MLHCCYSCYLIKPDKLRFENENQLSGKKSNRDMRRAPSFSGPLMLPNRASANSLSAPIKSSRGFRDSSDDKSKANLVQIKGRFSLTSENLDLVKNIPVSSVSRRSPQAPQDSSPLRKSASVGDWMLDFKQQMVCNLPFVSEPWADGNEFIYARFNSRISNLKELEARHTSPLAQYNHTLATILVEYASAPIIHQHISYAKTIFF